MLEELLKQMAGEFPMLSKIFVEERDLYMANALHSLLEKSTFDKRVAWSKTDGKLLRCARRFLLSIENFHAVLIHIFQHRFFYCVDFKIIFVNVLKAPNKFKWR